MSENNSEIEHQMGKYANPDYWEKRYTDNPESVEWYLRYSDMSEYITRVVSKEDRILIVGAGNSNLTIDMFKDGFSNITSTDISDTVVEAMKQKLDKYRLDYFKEDVLNMQFEPNSVDVIIDKGLLDSLLCKENANVDADKMVKEVYRVLGKRGRFLCVSHNSERNTYFKTQDWEVEINPLSLKDMIDLDSSKGKKNDKKKNDKAEHYLYIMTKN